MKDFLLSMLMRTISLAKLCPYMLLFVVSVVNIMYIFNVRMNRWKSET